MYFVEYRIRGDIVKINFRKLVVFSLVPIILLAITIIVIRYVKNIEQSNPTNGIVTDANKLKHTDITPQMDIQIEKGKNLVYCSTFQLAWNELKDNIIKGDIIISGEGNDAELMNKSLSTQKDISENDYVAMAGYNKNNIIGTINNSLKDKFGEKAPVITEKLDSPDDIFAYAYLDKELKFMYMFDPLKKKISFNNDNVDGFGIDKFQDNEQDEKLASQVEILDYKDDSNFIINLKAKDTNDQIILAELQPERTLVNTINEVNSRINSGQKEKLVSGDTLQIPSIHFNTMKEFSQFERRYLKNEGFTDYEIIKAVQNIKFNLDRNGAEIESDARIVMSKSMPSSIMIIKTKELVFDKPFLLMLKKNNSIFPYFAIWVENTEILK